MGVGIGYALFYGITVDKVIEKDSLDSNTYYKVTNGNNGATTLTKQTYTPLNLYKANVTNGVTSLDKQTFVDDSYYRSTVDNNGGTSLVRDPVFTNNIYKVETIKVY